MILKELAMRSKHLRLWKKQLPRPVEELVHPLWDTFLGPQYREVVAN
jgi:hypothetical protein